MKRLLTIIILSALVLCSGCATTTITKPDKTEIKHSTLLVNTKNIEMVSDGNKTIVIIGTMTTDIEALSKFAEIYLNSQTGVKLP
jgi:hypothetical protein